MAKSQINSESLVFLSGKRTPFGAYGGTLRDVNPTDLGVSASKAALEQARVEPHEIDHVIIGNVLHSAADSVYTPRHLGLQLGIPPEVPALGINRLCGSGFQVIVEAFQQILAGDTRIALVGGVENMSMTPYVLRGARWGMKMGNSPIHDSMTDSLYDSHIKMPMGITAENVAKLFQISRKESDNFALTSQRAYQQAALQGRFQDEIVSFEGLDSKGKVIVLERDEHPKHDSNFEKLARLKPVFEKEGVVTAGNASGIVDGAAALVVASESEAQRRGVQPLGRLVSYGVVGCDPKIMGMGPVAAAKLALKKAHMKLSQLDLIEINEAFAPQTLAVAKELNVPHEILNVKGGAIALGHPLAASGTRIIQTLLYELKRRKKKFGLGAACIGGGQGIALVIESLLN